MAHDHWQLNPGGMMLPTWWRRKDGQCLIFMNVGATNTTVGNLESNFVGATWSGESLD
jgi:hypothetical protein